MLLLSGARVVSLPCRQVTLEVAGEMRKLLPDESDRIDLAVIGITQQERSEAASSLQRIGPASPGSRFSGGSFAVGAHCNREYEAVRSRAY